MTHPMTGQPATEDERTEATQKANAELSKMLENGEITKGFDDGEDSDEKTDDEKLAELREFKKNNQDLYEDNGKGGQQIAVEDDETEMVVTDNDGQTTTYTRDEWDNERGTRMRTWKRMERDGLMFVRVARWFNNEDMKRVQTGRGFYGHKVGETDKALKFEVPGGEGLSAQAETVWVPKKAVRTHELI